MGGVPRGRRQATRGAAGQARSRAPEKRRQRRETLILGDDSRAGIRDVAVEDFAADPFVREQVLGTLRLTSPRGPTVRTDEK
jgi:hypothetical protein